MIRESTLLANPEKFELSLIKSCQDKRKYVEEICEYFSKLNDTKSEETRMVGYLFFMCSLYYHPGYYDILYRDRREKNAKHMAVVE